MRRITSVVVAIFISFFIDVQISNSDPDDRRFGFTMELELQHSLYTTTLNDKHYLFVPLLLTLFPNYSDLEKGTKIKDMDVDPSGFFHENDDYVFRSYVLVDGKNEA